MQLHDYSYSQPAILTVPWENHKYKSGIEDCKITIQQLLSIRLEENSIVNFHINRDSVLAGFSARPIDDSFNKGPYMDILECSFKPMDKFPCVHDSIGPTQSREISWSVGENQGSSFELNGTIKPEKGWGDVSLGPKVHIVEGKTTSTAYKTSEFQKVTRLFEEKK